MWSARLCCLRAVSIRGACVHKIAESVPSKCLAARSANVGALVTFHASLAAAGLPKLVQWPSAKSRDDRTQRDLKVTRRFKAAARRWQPAHGLMPSALVARFTASPRPRGWLMRIGSATEKRPLA